MRLTEVMKAVDERSPDELRQLRDYIRQREQPAELQAGTLNLAELLAGLEAMREGLTDAEFAEIERAMNGSAIAIDLL